MSATVEKRVAIVGAELQANAYAAALRELPELRLVSVVGGRYAAHQPEADVPRFANVGEMLEVQGAPDFALVTTPPGRRRGDIEKALRAGVDVLIAPPLATRLEDAQALTELAELTGRELTTASPFRASAGFKRAEQLIREGAIGELQYLEINLEHKVDARTGWRAEPEVSGGGIWMQHGSCALDIAEILAGPVCRLRILQLESYQSSSVEDQAVIETDHGDGILGRIRLSWNGGSRRPLALCVGSQGELAVGYSQLILRVGDAIERIAPGHDAHDALVGSLREHLRRRCTSQPPMDSGPDRVNWIEAGYRSVRENRWQS